MDTKPGAAPGPSEAPDRNAGSLLATPPRLRRGIGDRLVGGLILAMPVLITYWVFHWMYSTLAVRVIDPVALLVLWKFKWITSSTELPYWFEAYAAPLIAVLVVLVLLYYIDYLADTRLHRAVDWLLANVPVISSVYSPVQKMFQALESKPGHQEERRLVLIEFPHPGVKLPAFVTARCRDLATDKVVLCVYVPTTPVPTSGFFLLVPEEDVTELNWNSEQTLQAIMSGGLSAPPDVNFCANRRSAVAPQTIGERS